MLASNDTSMSSAATEMKVQGCFVICTNKTLV
jgi:hypothetical protein